MNVKIRRAEPSDAKAIKDIYECPNAYSGTLQLPFPSNALWEQRLANTPDNFYLYVALVDNETVGHIGFEVSRNVRRRHVGSFGMAVKDGVQGHGVGSVLLSTVIDLADNWLNLKRIELTVFSDNDRAVGLYKKHGFEIEGESKAFAFRNGEYVDAYHMARVLA
ncbi:GNAT family N-acetyltransferase [Saccharospirillum salsuginis]|uniref:Acetyltransferase n=1 Tax=Saccharospirillum salsuginis TaxID=418750 RepID=A0A918NJM7_9GAMM|nr:GNAT family N-acetyltransferase [Saccharospirillum salsuginis]GGX72426.1 acetyltransferase [Saccharospirillum salsuginis]